ncbi:uncharacterized protein EAE97_010353 [Botrytis byssoidea]|uniref:Autophagy-related protein 16 domain-containing protein n=1 Tax=Botrytis byssoidea TaxID=139641 RepID=A0A9P5LTT4_9HELO|nr:uncharacterized protein EAE97_010353 [Botrytis byssoidea]KAF7926053.1 hypothetical protein EAE97_010353 [Botrytis byssoidea]
MSTDQLVVKLRYTKSQREMIEKIVTMESIVAREDATGATGGQNIRNDKQPNAPTKLPMVEKVRARLRSILRRGDCHPSTKYRDCISLLEDTLESVTDSVATEDGAGGSGGQQQRSAKDKDTRKEIEDLQIKIARLLAENEKLEATNNELICDVDKNEAELSELREEVGRVRDNESNLEEITNSLETSRNYTDKALSILTSLKKKENTYRERVFALKKELQMCRAERDEALANLDSQTESFENEHKTLVDENTKLEATLTGFKRKLDCVMEGVEGVEDATSHKKR